MEICRTFTEDSNRKMPKVLYNESRDIGRKKLVNKATFTLSPSKLTTVSCHRTGSKTPFLRPTRGFAAEPQATTAITV